MDSKSKAFFNGNHSNSVEMPEMLDGMVEAHGLADVLNALARNEYRKQERCVELDMRLKAQWYYARAVKLENLAQRLPRLPKTSKLSA